MMPNRIEFRILSRGRVNGKAQCKLRCLFSILLVRIVASLSDPEINSVQSLLRARSRSLDDMALSLFFVMDLPFYGRFACLFLSCSSSHLWVEEFGRYKCNRQVEAGHILVVRDHSYRRKPLRDLPKVQQLLVEIPKDSHN